MSHATLYDPALPELLRKAAAAYRRRDDPCFRAFMEDAAARAPHRIDLRVCVANHCIQTGQPEQALDIFEELTRMVPRDADILFCLAHWRRYLADDSGAEQARRQLAKIRAGRAADLARLWQCIDAWTLREPADRLPTLPSGAKRKAVFVAGYVLAPDGTMQRDLIERLEKTLEAAERFPDAAIVVSGGVPKAGKAEAVLMSAWLRERGVADDRIYEEGSSRDLVENVVYSRQILDLLDIDAVLAVNAAGNFRRTGAIFETIAQTCGSAWTVRMVAASGNSLARFRDNGSDALKLYRDVLRAYGMPMMAVYPELAER